MGATQYFAWLSDRPEYNAKVRAGFVMAPPVFMGDATSFLVSSSAQEVQDIWHGFGRLSMVIVSGTFKMFMGRLNLKMPLPSMANIEPNPLSI